MIYNIIELLWGVSQIVLNWDSSVRNNEKIGIYPALFKTLNAPFAVPPVAKTSSKIKTFPVPSWTCIIASPYSSLCFTVNILPGSLFFLLLRSIMPFSSLSASIEPIKKPLDSIRAK